MLPDRKTNMQYPEFTDYLRQRFPYFKVQKISLNAGFTCPNRDGTKGIGGCTYCNNQTFNPDYCRSDKSITAQLHEGIRFFSHKYPGMKYIAYFQAYTNTYASLQTLKSKYEEALSVDGVVGIIIGTRPDCISDALLDYLEALGKSVFVMIEYGVESMSNDVLRRINRGHTCEIAEEAILRTARRGIATGAHLILGLPGESKAQLLRHADRLAALPLTSIKLHQLQLIRNTAMGDEYEQHPDRFQIFTRDEYIRLLIDFIRRLGTGIYIDRFVSQSPGELLLAPAWGIKNHLFRAQLAKQLAH